MRKVRLTAHAEAKMAERRILRLWIERTVLEPDWVEPEPRDPAVERRFAAIAGFGGRILRVVCVENGAEIRIITAMFDRNARAPG